ncbi:ABC transporter ATP-binding protein [Candidatus Peregrinibacteria bacterium]|nr:MAG: ABC transporter ATP-binding protein [Candidatus Peregrinibacteria bacterium]
MNNKLLNVTNLDVHFGPTQVIHNVDYHVNEGEILILMGPNGAGKTVLLKSTFGLFEKSTGTVEFDGKVIHPHPSSMVEAGMSFVGQGKRVFPSLTIEENLRMGAYLWSDKKMIQARTEELIQFFPVLKKKFKQIAYYMSGGEQQILALARGLMMNPKLLLLDEPSIGLAPKIVQSVFEKIAEINKTFGTSIVVVEHNLKSLLNIAHRGYILAEGKMLMEGPVEKLADSKNLEKVFFGEIA